MAPGAQLVLVETSPVLAGLLPFRAWDVIGTSDVVLVRDLERHPSAPHLYFAGVDLEALAPATVEARTLNLLEPGDPAERRLAKGLVDRAERDGRAVYLLGPGDEEFGRLVGLDAAKRGGGVEVEFVFLDSLPRGTELLRLVEVERALRDPDGGCPWDLEQDHRSLARYLLEETYELVDAIEDGTSDADLAEELGDVLLQVVFHAQIATDRRAFSIDDVARGIADKLVRRHPHVFGDAEVADADEVKDRWEVLKQQEKGRTGPFEGVARSLPALLLATELQRKAAKLGFDWRDASEPRDRVAQELDELDHAATPEQREEELGDLLGAVVGLARHLDVDAEAALRRAATKFEQRFEAVLAQAAADDLPTRELDRDAWLRLWEQVKASEPPPAGS